VPATSLHVLFAQNDPTGQGSVMEQRGAATTPESSAGRVAKTIDSLEHAAVDDAIAITIEKVEARRLIAPRFRSNRDEQIVHRHAR
jgi:hypothetical protein